MGLVVSAAPAVLLAASGEGSASLEAALMFVRSVPVADLQVDLVVVLAPVGLADSPCIVAEDVVPVGVPSPAFHPVVARAS